MAKKAEGRLINLSCHGALVAIPIVFPLGEPVALQFDLLIDRKERRFTLKGEVVRLSAKGTAVEFTNVPPEVGNILMNFAMKRLAKKT